MKIFFKKLLVVIAVIVATFATINTFSPASVYADSNSVMPCNGPLGLQPWYCGLPAKNGEIQIQDEDGIVNGAVIIAANIFVDMTVIAAYLILGYVIYGGYQYIFSSGDPGKVASGKKTLAHAFIGFAIVMLASVILNTIRIAILTESGKLSGIDCINSTSSECIDPNTLVTNFLGWILGVAGVGAVVFLVIGGIGYVTSSGDPAKLKKARDTIIYALIGLAIVGFAQVITAIVANIVKDSKNNAYLDETLIAKEHHEN